MRILGGTGRRTRRRNNRDVKRSDPTIDEWKTAMEKPGGEGGCRESVGEVRGVRGVSLRKCVLDDGLRLLNGAGDVDTWVEGHVEGSTIIELQSCRVDENSSAGVQQ